MALLKNAMVIICALLAFSLVSAQAPSPWAIEELMGKKAPDFTLADVQGATVSLASLKGNVLLINFWATWCPPCRDEMPALDRLEGAYRGKGFRVIGIATDKKVSEVSKFLGRRPVGFRVLTDPDLAVARQYGVFSMPTTFLVGKNGAVVRMYLGGEDWDSREMREEIQRLLNE